MNSHEIKLKVRSFIKEFDIRELDYMSLKDISQRMGYTVVEYNHIINDD